VVPVWELELLYLGTSCNQSLCKDTMAEDYAQASPEEKLRIASHFILSSPNGEVDEVIADVKTLMADSALLSDVVIEKLLKQYNLDNYVFAPLAAGHNVSLMLVLSFSDCHFSCQSAKLDMSTEITILTPALERFSNSITLPE
jgi:hypothetical protein